MPAKSDGPRRAFVVSHTHWDREWYLTYHRFRVSLVRIFGQVLDALEDDGEFRHFLLDGQAIALEDHLEVRPEDEGRIRRLVEAGRLSIGPWYVLPDEFLISPEAHVRNLLIGHRVCARFGGAQKVGYMPDSFGHIGQMPQILSRAGIDTFVYTRGNGSEIDDLGCEYRWEATDGSEVLAINQVGGYCNASGLGHEEIWHAHTQRQVVPERAVEQIRTLFDRIGPVSHGDSWLLMNGCDHFPPQRDFAEVLGALGAAFPETEFVHTGLGDYLEAAREEGCGEKRFRGELLGGRLHLILSGVWSARMNLKQANDEAEVRLERVAEPIAAGAHFLYGVEYPAGLLGYAWKLLLKNAPHDSICGCSIDEVHREMMPRFAGVIETADQVVRERAETLLPAFAVRADGDRETVIAVLNPLPIRRAEVVTRLVVFQPAASAIEEYDLVDEADYVVPFEVVEDHYVERFWGIDYRAELSAEEQRTRFGVYADQFGHRIIRPESERDERDRYVTIRFVAEDLPGVGHRLYRFREGGSGPAHFDAVIVKAGTIENEHLRVRLNGNGRFDLHDKRSGEEHLGLNLLTDVEDAGDEYDWSPAAESLVVSSEDASGTIRTIESGGLVGALEADLVLTLPAGLTTDRRQRREDAVDCPVRVRVCLTAGSPVVDVRTIFVNRVEDHRLRASFPTSIATDRLVSDGHFEVVDRPVDPPDDADWVQPHPGTAPQREFSLLSDGERGLAVFARGLPEVQASREDGGTRLDLTLLRAVGWLSRDDFPTRRNQNAGPTVPTPEAQCPGEHVFRYAVVPFAGPWLDAGVKPLSERWRTPSLTKQGVLDGARSGGAGLVEKTSDRTSITAIKRHEERDTLIVRVVNLAAEPVEERLRFGLPVQAAWRTNLLEERECEVEPAGAHTLAISLAPHEIATREIALR